MIYVESVSKARADDNAICCSHDHLSLITVIIRIWGHVQFHISSVNLQFFRHSQKFRKIDPDRIPHLSSSVFFFLSLVESDRTRSIPEYFHDPLKMGWGEFYGLFSVDLLLSRSSGIKKHPQQSATANQHDVATFLPDAFKKRLTEPDRKNCLYRFRDLVLVGWFFSPSFELKGV